MKTVKVKYISENRIVTMYHLKSIDDIFDYLDKFSPVLSIKLARCWCNEILDGRTIVVNSATHYWCNPDNKSVSILEDNLV